MMLVTDIEVTRDVCNRLRSRSHGSNTETTVTYLQFAVLMVRRPSGLGWPVEVERPSAHMRRVYVASFLNGNVGSSSLGVRAVRRPE